MKCACEQQPELLVEREEFVDCPFERRAMGYVVAPAHDALCEHVAAADNVLHSRGGISCQLDDAVTERLQVRGANGGPNPDLIVRGA